MNVSVNEKTVEVSSEDGSTLDTLLQGLRRRGEIAPGQVVVDLQVDGRKCQAVDIDRLTAMLLQDIEAVSISTTGLQGYADRILIDARGMLGVIVEATGEVAVLLRAGEIHEANVHLSHLFEALQEFLGCLHRVQGICDLSQRPFDAEDPLLQRLSAGLSTIQLSQQAEDWPALAERLELDLIPALEGFDATIEAMRGEL